MATKKAVPVRRPLRREPTHPGEILREDVLPALRMTVSAAARELGVSRQLLHRILAGKAPVTPEMAVRLGKWAGNGPALWLSTFLLLLERRFETKPYGLRDLVFRMRSRRVAAAPEGRRRSHR